MDQFKPAIKEAITSMKTMVRAIEMFTEALENYQDDAAPAQEAEPVKSAPTAKKKTAAPKKPAATPKKKKTAPTSRKKKATPKKDQPVTDREKVRRIIVRSKNGIDVDALAKKTGFARKKVSHIAHHLIKQGKIKRPKLGFYTKP